MNTNENSTEFRRAEQLTLQMQLTPEQYRAMAEWAKSIPGLFFLDICVVGATKLSQELLDKNPRKSNIVKHLQSLDRKQHGFSYLLALMEKVSDSEGIASDAELEERILEDLAALRRFFKNAHVSEADDFVIKFLRELRREAIESQRPNYLDFLNQCNGALNIREPIASALRIDKAKEIIVLANSLKISHQHPIVILAISCVYGNVAAKKLMKFKADALKFHAENVLADIMAITRFARLKLQIEYLGRSGGKYLRCEYITDDNGLIGVINCFQPDVVKHEESSDGVSTQYTFTVKLKQLLTEIGEDEYDQLLGLLGNSDSVASRVE